MPKIGIICAVEKELSPFLPHIQGSKTSQKAMLTFYEGKILGMDTAAVFCGVCKTNAAIATQILIDAYHVDIVINGGTAGGMDESVDILDTVISTEIAHHDMNQTILTDYHPWMSSPYFHADETLVRLSKAAIKPYENQYRIHFGRMVSGEAFIADEGRDAINAVFNPLSTDMETASIAQTCYVNRVPFIAIRAITDSAKRNGNENATRHMNKASEISKEIVLALIMEIKEHRA